MKPKKAAKKKASPKRAKRIRTIRTRNAGTMTESGFFSWLRSSLRRRAMIGWRPIQIVRNRARIAYKGANKRRKYSYICEKCGNPFDGKNVAVHHIEECGTLTCFNDLGAFAKRLFCEEDGLILLCDDCHTLEHQKQAI